MEPLGNMEHTCIFQNLDFSGFSQYSVSMSLTTDQSCISALTLLTHLPDEANVQIRGKNQNWTYNIGPSYNLCHFFFTFTIGAWFTVAASQRILGYSCDEGACEFRSKTGRNQKALISFWTSFLNIKTGSSPEAGKHIENTTLGCCSCFYKVAIGRSCWATELCVSARAPWRADPFFCLYLLLAVLSLGEWSRPEKLK